MDADQSPLRAGEHGRHPRRALLARGYGEQLRHEATDDERGLPRAVVSRRRGEGSAEETLRPIDTTCPATVPAYRRRELRA